MNKTTDIAVGGRFHADHLARALEMHGCDVRLWSTFPRNRFPTLKQEQVASYILPELIFRSASRVGLESAGDVFKMRSFGRWLARHTQTLQGRDLLFTWSSFGLEALRQRTHTCQVVIRDSFHIREQMRILDEAYRSLGVVRPNRAAVVERELEEYALADRIVVLSPIAKASFEAQGIKAKKLQELHLGVDLDRFTDARRERRKLPLRVLYFGTLSVRKGAHLLLEAANRLSSSFFRFTCIGDIEPVLKSRFRSLPAHVTHFPAMPQADLVPHLHRHDLFVMPTIEDGFGQTLIQAMASGLVPVVSNRCGAAEIVKDGVQGFRILPTVDSLIEGLEHALHAWRDLDSVQAEAVRTAQQCSWAKYDSEVGAIVDRFLGPSDREKERSF